MINSLNKFSNPTGDAGLRIKERLPVKAKDNKTNPAIESGKTFTDSFAAALEKTGATGIKK